MAENNNENNDNLDVHAHAKSIAFLQDQARVSGFAFDKNEHISKQPSDLQQIEEAQIVSGNKDSFVPQQETAPTLQSGPAKKYIDQPAVPLSNFAAANIDAVNDPNDNNTDDIFAGMGTNDNNNNNNSNNNTNTNTNTNNNTNNPTDSLDAFAPATNETDQQNYESFFGGDNNDNNDNNNINNNNAGNNGIIGDENDENHEQEEKEEEEEEEQQENKQTFLSVWQEQHREQLAKKGKEEREAQQVSIENGKKELEEFNEKRRIQIENARKEAKTRENDLKQDYNAVFQHGTIWQQVAKLVDLKTENPTVSRFKDLLIVLKNQDEQKSDK